MYNVVVYATIIVHLCLVLGIVLMQMQNTFSKTPALDIAIVKEEILSKHPNHFIRFRNRFSNIRNSFNNTQLSKLSVNGVVGNHASSEVEGVFLLSTDSRRVSGGFRHFWRSTGFCPPKPHNESFLFDLGSDMVHNLAYIGAIPHNGIEQVRIHWLLDLITIDRFDQGTPVYNFTHLVKLLDALYLNGLRPGFELMGNPSAYFADFENTTQIYQWKDLIAQIATLFIGEYGLGQVMAWNFETWNEPDCHDFDQLKMSVQGFLNYYDACSEGLRSVSSYLKFGGPGDACHDTKSKGYAMALYQHVVNGTNFFTGETGVRMDFLSLHRKGSGLASKIIYTELDTMVMISTLFPTLANVTFYNDEADPLVGWSKDEAWRADATYAAMVIKVIVQHQNIILAKSPPPINYKLLSNDNSFLSYYPHQFTQRTLLARLQINDTDPHYTEFIRKPVYSALSILSLLGDEQTQCIFLDNHGRPIKNDSNYGVLATVHTPVVPYSADSWQMTVVLYRSNDTHGTEGVQQVNLTVGLYPPNDTGSLMGTLYVCEHGTFDPFLTWSEAGKPPYPNRVLMEILRKQQGPSPVILSEIYPGENNMTLSLQGNSVNILHVCAKATRAPDQANSVNIYNITTGEVLITWSDSCLNTKCVAKYDIQYSQNQTGPFVKINFSFQTFVTQFVYQPDTQTEANVRGFYRVRAIDYWERPGPYSLPAPYPEEWADRMSRRRREHHCQTI